MTDASLEPPLYPFDLGRRLAAEALGTAMLLAIVIGSGIMGDRLASGNVAIALLGNTLSTGAGPGGAYHHLRPVSGAHFNPAKTAVFVLRREIDWRMATLYVFAKTGGAVLGVRLAHAMFAEPIFQISLKHRDGGGSSLVRVRRYLRTDRDDLTFKSRLSCHSRHGVASPVVLGLSCPVCAETAP